MSEGGRGTNWCLPEVPLPCLSADGIDQQDFSATYEDARSVQVVFRNLQERLVDFIREFDVLIGAVAWVTDEVIIDQLASKRVALIVQKEDFLRPDLGGSKSKLRRLYDSLASGLVTIEMPAPTNRLLGGMPFAIDPIRCVGNFNRSKSPAFPRMHNKFLIGCDYIDNELCDPMAEYNSISPRAVWSGSYNFTVNALSGFENAIIIRDTRIASAYLQEWAQIFTLSEALDWSSDWIQPQYYIGT